MSNRLGRMAMGSGLVLVACALAFARTVTADDVDKRQAFARELSKDVARSGLKKVYMPDFTDSSGKQSVLGRFFAGTFSGMLDQNAKGFVVLNRVEVHRYLGKSEKTDHDLSMPEVLAKLVSDLGPDAIVWGSVLVNQDVATIDLVAREPSGKELFHSRYEEKLDANLEADFEASQSGRDSYFVGLDGVTMPKCLRCPMPYYPVGQGSPSLEGDVVLSVLVTVEGNADQIRLVQSLSPVFDRAAMEEVSSWHFGAAHDAEGKSVPVRLPVQVTFKKHWQVR